MKSVWKVVAMLLVFAAAVGRGEEPRTNLWRVQVGGVHQWARHMRVEGPAPTIPQSVWSGLPALEGISIQPGLPTTPFYPITVANPFPNSIFDDGYLGPDQQTSPTPIPGYPDHFGMTVNWHADSPAQYDQSDPSHPVLNFKLTDEAAALGNTVLTSDGKQNDLPTDGIELKLSRRLYTWTNSNIRADRSGLTLTNGYTTLDLVAGLVWFPPDRQRSTRAASQSLSGIVEHYAYLDYWALHPTPGIPVVPLTDFINQGYAGSYSDLYGPLLPAQYDSWYASLGNTIGTVRDTVQFDSRVWRLRGELGVTLTKDITRDLSAYVSPLFALEFVDMYATRRETLTYTDAGGTTTISSRMDNNQKMAVVPGFLLTAGADYLISETWFVGASLGWEWLTRDPSIRVGPSRLKFDLDGGEFSLYLGRNF